MKVYLAARYKGAENKQEIDELASAIHAAGAESFCFVRDVEHFKIVPTEPKDLWQRTLEAIKSCDALVVDVSDLPTGGRVAEAGIAFALGLPIFTLVHRAVKYKTLYDGISTKVIAYKTYDDIVSGLRPCFNIS